MATKPSVPTIKVKKLSPDAHLPVYATAGSGCFDLAAAGGPEAHLGGVMPGRPLTVSTGLAFEIPEGSVMLVFSRSGHGFNDDIRLANCTGIIDSDYRGDVKVKLTGDGGATLPVFGGQRIAQGLIVSATQVDFKQVDELSETVRGAGGLGSTGA